MSVVRRFHCILNVADCVGNHIHCVVSQEKGHIHYTVVHVQVQCAGTVHVHVCTHKSTNQLGLSYEVTVLVILFGKKQALLDLVAESAHLQSALLAVFQCYFCAHAVHSF